MYIKFEEDKFHSRPQYIVTHRSRDLCELKKMNNGKFMSRSLQVPAHDLFKVQKPSPSKVYERPILDTDDSDEDDPDVLPVDPSPQHEQQPTVISADAPSSVPTSPATPNQSPSSSSQEDKEEKEEVRGSKPAGPSSRPKRNCGPPKRLIDELTGH